MKRKTKKYFAWDGRYGFHTRNKIYHRGTGGMFFILETKYTIVGRAICYTGCHKKEKLKQKINIKFLRNISIFSFSDRHRTDSEKIFFFQHMKFYIFLVVMKRKMKKYFVWDGRYVFHTRN